jgi:signal transduction histidine kinase
MVENNNLIADKLEKNHTTSPLSAANVFQSPGMVVLIHPDTKQVLYADDKFKTSLGYTEAQLSAPSFSFLSVVDGAQGDRFNLQLQEVAEGAPLSVYSAYRLKTAGGERKVHYIYIYPVSSGEYSGLIQLYLMPEFSKMEVPFISFDTREFFLGQFGAMGFGTFEWIIESNKVYWSEGIYSIYELERNEGDLNYADVRQYTHPDDAARAGVVVQNAVKNGGAYDIELRIKTARHNIKVIRATGKTIQDQSGKPIKLLGSIRDVTHQRAIEQDLKKNVAELHRSNAELEEFAYVASHDLQEPLRKITTFCDRLSDKYADMLTGEGAMYMDRIMASAENMRMLIHNLLEFSRITKANEPAQPVNLSFVIHQVKQELELLIEETHTKLQVQQLPTVFASMVQLKQLFMNLVNNAIKFRKADTAPIIKIYTQPVTNEVKERHYLNQSAIYEEIIVEDNGIGLDNEYAERIFQIFQRLHGKAEYPGSGIGLAICRKIVEKYKGVIFAEGESGSGTRFHVILPVDNPDI